MSKKENIAILIMAAGKSSRMQSIKQLLPWKNSNLILNAIKTAKGIQSNHIYVILGANAEKINKKANLDKEDITVIENPTWQNGLGNSIAYGVDHVLKQNILFNGLLICLADQPLLKSTYYQKMIHEFQSGNYRIVATKYKNRAGVPALFHQSMASELTVLDADYGAKEILNKYQKSIFMMDAGEQVTDIDTEEEYFTLYKQHN